MSPNLLLALELTAVGMGLVFASILVFWGLMAGLVRVTAERPRAPADAAARAAAESPPAERAREREQEQQEEEARRTAAALAVAVLLARDGARSRRPLPGWSAWRAAARVGRG